MKLILTLEVKNSDGERSLFSWGFEKREMSTYQRTFEREAPKAKKKNLSLYLPHQVNRTLTFEPMTDIRTLEPVLFKCLRVSYPDQKENPGSGITSSCRVVDEIADGLLASGWSEVFDGFEEASGEGRDQAADLVDRPAEAETGA